MLRRRLALSVALFALASTACGDVNVVRLRVRLADDVPAQSLRALRIITRTVPEDPTRACIGFETGELPPGESLSSGEAIVAYPVRDATDLEFDLGGGRPPGNIDISLYSALTFVVLAHPTLDVQASEPVAGACETQPIDREGRIELELLLEPVS